MRKERIIEFSPQGFPFCQCKLYPFPIEFGGQKIYDTRKPWTIVFYQLNTKTGKLERRAIKKFQREKGVKTRLALFVNLMERIDYLLENGYTHNPELGNTFAIKDKSQTTFLQDLDQFIAQKRVERLSELTIEGYIKYVKSITKYLTEFYENEKFRLKTTNFSIDLAISYQNWLLEEPTIKGKQRSSKKINDCVAFFSSFFKSNFRVNRLSLPNPFEYCNRLSEIQTEMFDIFTQSETDLIFSEMRRRGDFQLLLFCSFIYYTFCRITKEMRRLKVGDIFENHIKISGVNNKSDNVKYPTLPGQLNALIDELKIREYDKDFYVFGKGGFPSEVHYGENHFSERFRTKYLLPLGLDKNHSIYCLKHTGNVRLIEQHGDIRLNTAQNGHTEERTTKIYLRKFVRQIDARMLAGF